MINFNKFLLFFLTITISLFFTAAPGLCSGKKVDQDDEYYYNMGRDLFKEGYYQLMPEGKTEEGRQKLGQAVAALEVAISMNDQNIEAHYLLARIHAAMTDYQAAAEEYNRVIELAPENIDIYLFLASTYVQLDQYNKAYDVLNYAKTLTNNPQTVERIEALVQSIKENE